MTVYIFTIQRNLTTDSIFSNPILPDYKIINLYLHQATKIQAFTEETNGKIINLLLVASLLFITIVIYKIIVRVEDNEGCYHKFCKTAG